MKRVSAALLLASLCAAPSFATTYVRVEADGSKTYSDRPLPGGQPVEIQPAQTYSAPPPPPIGAGTSKLPREQQLLREMTDFKYASCAITPKNEETFSNPTSVNVAVMLSPALRVGDVVDLKIDGAKIGGESTLTFTLPQPARGAHTVSLSIRDRYGKAMCGANSTFNVFRASLNAPARK